MTPTSPTIHSLKTVCDFVSNGFRVSFGGWKARCKADVSRVTIIKGKVYLDLVESNDSGAIIAKARANIWKRSVITDFLSKTGLDIKELKGGTIVFVCTLNFHVEYGFSLSIEELSHEFTIGNMSLERRKLLSSLRQEGLIDRNKQQSLGYPPLTIAVISNAGSQGRTDMETVLTEAQIPHRLRHYNAAIHGNPAIREVHQQLQNIYRDIHAGERIDAVCIVRGGGGASGIARRDHENIVRGVCHMPIPVIVAVGHTIDTSALDDVARQSAKTPTDAAYIIIKHYEQRKQKLTDVHDQIVHHGQSRLRQLSGQLAILSQSISLSVSHRLRGLRSELSHLMDIIALYDPQSLTKRGYAIIRNEDGHVIDRHGIETLSVGDNLVLEVFERNIRVAVQEAS